MEEEKIREIKGKKKTENEFDFDATLYQLRLLRAGLNIFKNFDSDSQTTEFSYCEFAQLVWLFLDQNEKHIGDLDGIIEDLIKAGAKDYEIKV